MEELEQLYNKKGEKKPLCYMSDTHSLTCLRIGVFGDLTLLSRWLDRHFVPWKASDGLSNSFEPRCGSCVFTPSRRKKALSVQMPEQLGY